MNNQNKISYKKKNQTLMKNKIKKKIIKIINK